MEVIRISALEHPTNAQIEETAQLASDAFETAIMNRTMTAGNQELREDLFRLTFRAAALEGKLYICQAAECGRIVAIAAGFGPGARFLGSEAQRALGFDEFFNKLPEETKDWWRGNLMKPKTKQVNEKVQQSLRLLTVATRCDEQGKGYGSALIKEIARTAETPVCVNVNTDINILFYKRLGFEIVDAFEMVSSYGSWVGTTMIWEASE